MKSRSLIELTLVMTYQEAKWLKDLIEDPLNRKVAEARNESNKEYRKVFWDVLEKEGIR